MRKTLITGLILILSLLSNNNSYAFKGDIAILVAPQSIQYHLEDPQGNISGYTPEKMIFRIPDITIYVKSEEPTSGDDVNPEDQKFNSLYPNTRPTNINSGKYKLVLYGSTQSTDTNMSIVIYWDNDLPGNTSMKYWNRKLIYPNVRWAYEFDIPEESPTNNHDIILTKISTATDLITDIKISNQLGYIGSIEFINKLNNKISATALLKGNQKQEYENILSELNQIYNTPSDNIFIKQEGYNIIKEDLEYLINHSK